MGTIMVHGFVSASIRIDWLEADGKADVVIRPEEGKSKNCTKVSINTFVSWNREKDLRDGGKVCLR